MKVPLHKKIEAYIREKKKVHAGDLETFIKSCGQEAYTGRRRAQEMTQRGHRNFNPNIRKDYEKGCVVYFWQEMASNLPLTAPQKPLSDTAKAFLDRFCQPVKKVNSLF